MDIVHRWIGTPLCNHVRAVAQAHPTIWRERIVTALQCLALVALVAAMSAAFYTTLPAWGIVLSAWMIAEVAAVLHNYSTLIHTPHLLQTSSNNNDTELLETLTDTTLVFRLLAQCCFPPRPAHPVIT